MILSEYLSSLNLHSLNTVKPVSYILIFFHSQSSISAVQHSCMKSKNTKIRDLKYILKYINHALKYVLSVYMLNLLKQLCCYTLDFVLGEQSLRRFLKDKVSVFSFLVAFLSAVLVILPSLQPCNYNKCQHQIYDDNFLIYLNFKLFECNLLVSAIFTSCDDIVIKFVN